MRRRIRLILLFVLLFCCSIAFAQWRPIEGSDHPRIGTSDPVGIPRNICLFYDERTDDVGYCDGTWRTADQIHNFSSLATFFWDISERQWEEVGFFDYRQVAYEITGRYVNESQPIVIYSKKLNKWMNLSVYADSSIHDTWPDYLQLWEYYQEGWRPVIAPNRPEMRGSLSAAADDNGNIYMFGGFIYNEFDRKYPYGKVFSDTWFFNGATWKKLHIKGPSARSDASIAFDSKRKEFVLFGGLPIIKNKKGKIRTPNGTWLLSANRWRKAKAAFAPCPRSFAHMFYHPKMERVILYGGTTYRYNKKTRKWKYTDRSDIWTWDGKHWLLYDNDTRVDGKVIKSPITYDSRRNRMIAVHKRQLWEYRFSNKK